MGQGPHSSRLCLKRRSFEKRTNAYVVPVKVQKRSDIAFERLGKHNTKVDGAMQKKYELDIAENKLKERLGNLRDTPPTTCGKCNVCLPPPRERVEVTSSKRPLRRGNAKLPSKEKCTTTCVLSSR